MPSLFKRRKSVRLARPTAPAASSAVVLRPCIAENEGPQVALQRRAATRLLDHGLTEFLTDGRRDHAARAGAGLPQNAGVEVPLHGRAIELYGAVELVIDNRSRHRRAPG